MPSLVWPRGAGISTRSNLAFDSNDGVRLVGPGCLGLRAALGGVFAAGAAETFVAGAFFAGAFVAGAFVAGVFVAGVFVAGTFLAGAFFAGSFVAGAVFAVTFLAGAFAVGAFFAGAFVAELDFLVAAMCAPRGGVSAGLYRTTAGFLPTVTMTGSA
jgi:hypothetical protein